MTNRTQKREFNSPGRYTISMPFSCSITVHAWGAGGGAGGSDAGAQGGAGSPGLYNTRTFAVTQGGTLEVFVGTAGRGGGSNVTAAGTGQAGASRNNILGDSQRSLNGGYGGNAGPAGYSGAGGGGGGASGVVWQGSLFVVAAGGGGGGGAGIADGNLAESVNRSTAKITNNANGASGSDSRGENGQSDPDDGGGGGGGGGGSPGGQGGNCPSGDTTAFAGQCGGNFPVFGASTGTGTPYYDSSYAGGGAVSGGNGQNGRVVIIFDATNYGKFAYKVGGQWKAVQDVFTKVNGNWRTVETIFYKNGNNWKTINGAIDENFSFSSASGDYGIVVKNYS